MSDGIDVKLENRHSHHLGSENPSAAAVVVAAAVVTVAVVSFAAASTAVVDNSQQSRLSSVEIAAVVDFAAGPKQVHSVVNRCCGYFDDLMLYIPRHWS